MEYIYSLIDPRDGKVGYVGKTVDLCDRYKQHLANHDSSDTRKTRWIAKLARMQLTPEMRVLDVVWPDDKWTWQDKERGWIEWLKERGYRLLNHTDGGDGLHNPSADTRQKISVTRRKLFSDDPEFRAAYEKAWASPERRHKISEALTGQKHLWNSKLPQNQKGFVHSDEFKEKQRVASTGRAHSDVTKEKLRVINLGNVFGIGNRSRTGQQQSCEERAKKSEALRGRKKTDETKRKMSEARRAYWLRKKGASNGKLCEVSGSDPSATNGEGS